MTKRMNRLRRLLFSVLILTLVMTGLVPALAEDEGTRIPYAQLPADIRAAYESEMALAEKNARARAPGQTQLFAKLKGNVTPYTGSKSCNSLKVDYTVSQSVAKVGEEVYFYVNMECDYPPMVYVLGGLAFDESFEKTGDLTSNTDGVVLPADVTQKGMRIRYTHDKPGYFNFVIVVKDGNGNVVQLSTSTVMVYEEKEPPFSSISIDGNLALLMNVDRSKLDVGTVITANTEITTKADPVRYRGVWTLTDADGNVLDVKESSAEVNAQNPSAKIAFEYQPLQAGKLQFRITASDGDGNLINTNSPVLDVEDGFHFTARLNRVSALMVGNSVTATYNVYGHDCGKVSCYIGWECHDADGSILASKTEVVKERSGKVSYTPRVGQEIEFYVGATCEHFTGEYPARAFLALIGGLEVERSLTANTVAYGDEIGVNYSVSGGLEPYQKIVITGYTFDESRSKTYTFLTKTVTEAEGTVMGAPKLGDEVWFKVQVVEEDGNVTAWETGKAALTGAPEVTAPTLTASLSSVRAAVGETVTLTYRMSGGSGTISKEDPQGSYAVWKLLDGTAVHTQLLTGISGTSVFTPAEEGKYLCELVLTDGYHQQISWKSDTITVSAGIAGDANADGRVDLQDALLVMQYDAGWSVTLSKANADVDNSGAVNAADAVLILRYVSGESVVLK